MTGIFCSPICHDAEKVTDSLSGSSMLTASLKALGGLSGGDAVFLLRLPNTDKLLKMRKLVVDEKHCRAIFGLPNQS
jgi:hypothetical protein